MFVIKGRNGWRAETLITDVNGYDWKINTSKGNKGLSCTAQAGEAGRNSQYATFKCSLFVDPSIKLETSDQKCTQKAIEQLHIKGLFKFDELIESKKLPGKTSPTYKIVPGQIFGFHQITESPNKLVVYNLVTTDTFNYYEFLNTETLELGRAERIENIKDKFGIGYYYRENERMDLNELNNLVIQAKQREADLSQLEALKKEAQAEERAKNLEIGRRLVNVPDGTMAILIAQLKKDESDSYSDYYGHKTEAKLYLAFSSNRRDSFKEMRDAANNSEATKHLSNAPESFENREKYSMGRGYYLSENRHSGWEIRKTWFSGQQSELDELYIAAAEGRFFCNSHQKEETKHTPVANDHFQLSKTKHTIKGHDLYVIEVINRVEKSVFMELRKLAMKQDGYYSSYSKDGALPGFQFKTEVQATTCLQQFSQITNPSNHTQS